MDLPAEKTAQLSRTDAAIVTDLELAPGHSLGSVLGSAEKFGIMHPNDVLGFECDRALRQMRVRYIEGRLRIVNRSANRVGAINRHTSSKCGSVCDMGPERVRRHVFERLAQPPDA